MSKRNEPIVVNPSVVPDALGAPVRDVLIVLAAFPILAKLVGARDLSALLGWLQSSDGATFLAVVIPLALTAARAARAVVRKARFVIAARAAPDAVAVVVDPTPPPAADDVVAP